MKRQSLREIMTATAISVAAIVSPIASVLIAATDHCLTEAGLGEWYAYGVRQVTLPSNIPANCPNNEVIQQ